MQSTAETTCISLILAAANGEEDALQRVCNIYLELVYSWCRREGMQEADARDVTQEVFVRVGQRLETYDRNQARFRKWLWTVTRNAAVEYWRTNKCPAFANSELVEKFVQPPSSATDEVPPASVLRKAVVSEMNLLSLADREILTSTICKDRPASEIAMELGISVNNVYTRKSRALNRLRKNLEGMEQHFE